MSSRNARGRGPMSLGIFGRGRLGQALAQAAESREVEVAWQLGRDEMASGEVEVVIDASTASALPSHLEWASESGVDLVIATTGWEETVRLEEVNRQIGVLLAPNGSLTVALLARWARMLGTYAQHVAGADLYVFDHHHATKIDSPSGTARRLAAALEDGIREGTGSSRAQPPTVSIAAVRAGHEIGHHRIGLDAPGESLEISHRARSRETFAQGLITAATWLRGRRGVFTMDDVAADVLDPLFEQAADS